MIVISCINCAQKKKRSDKTLQSCSKLTVLMRKRDMAMKNLKKQISNIEKNKNLGKAMKDFQIQVFQVFHRELNNSGIEIFQSIAWLDNVLKGDIENIIYIEKSSEKRLNNLRSAALKEEVVYKQLLQAEKKFDRMKDLNQRHSKVKGVIVNILKEISKAADKLEKNLDDHVFDIALFESQKNQAAMEMVVRLAEKQNGPMADHEEAHSLPRLVDAYDNQFVLSRPADTTIPREDHNLLHDLAYLIMLSGIFGWLTHLCGLPTLFGHMAAGVCLGPGGFNAISSLVQLETLSQLGIFFILFTVGLEFSPDKIKKVAKLASFGSGAQMILLILGGACYSFLFKTSVKEGCFVAACFGLSSTPLVVKFLSKQEAEDNNS
ncbi:DgyrCDS5227 [Dimorphilus gyrociliatus]|uniref:DgyrCDS5227 n=1 Tax=Dimorphilus gyrociliatus TaxID=2664684 RepID=A0A7I8VJ68_9ANNE|nr:DgyrCDS5227 [Dimorphilus gyrociliatus]